MKQRVRSKIFKYAAIVVISVFVLLMLAYTTASLYVNSHKDRIISKIKEGIHASIHGNVAINNIDISLFSSFPFIGGVVSGLSITDSLNIPTLSAREAGIRISIFQLLNKHPSVARVVVKDGKFHLFTDSSGYTNQYIFAGKKKGNAAKEESTTSKIKGIILQNVQVIFEDALKSKKIDIYCKNLDAAIKQKDSVLSVRVDEHILINGLGFNLERGSFLENQNLSANNWKLKINTSSGTVWFDETKINIEGQPYAVSAKFHLKEPGSFQLHVKANNLDYRKAAALLTERIRKKMNHVSFAGPLQVEGNLSGSLAPGRQPLIKVEFQTQKNLFTTPILAFENCSFNGHFYNRVLDSLPISDENSEIMLTKFNSSWGDISLKTDTILLSDLTNAKISFNFSSNVDFQTLNDQLDLESVKFLQGSADVQLKYNGPLITTIELLNGISSSVFLKDATVLYVPRNLTFTHANGFIRFSSNDLVVKNLQCNVAENKFVVNISGTDLNHIASGDVGKSNINCDVFSPSINLDDFRAIFNSVKPEIDNSLAKKTKGKSGFSAVTSKIDNVLENGNLALSIKANNVSLGHFTASNINTNLLFRSADWQIRSATLHHAGGLLNLSAAISQQGKGFHAAQAHIDLKNVDVRKLFYAFDNFGQNGITYNNLKGIVNSSANLALRLNKNGDIVPNSLQGNLYFSLKKGELVDFLPLKQLNEIALLNRDFSHITFAELKDSLIIKDNQVFIRRMEIASSALHMYVEGVYGINKPTDILMEVPLSNLKMRQDDFVPENKGLHAKTGPSVYFRATAAAGESVKIKMELFRKKKKKQRD